MAKLSDFGLHTLPEYRDIDCTQVKVGRGHRYKVTGKKETLTSVTTITGVMPKPYLVPWARGQGAEKFRDRMLAVEPANHPGEDGYDDYIAEVYEWAKKDDRVAADDGTATHAMVEYRLTGKNHDVPLVVQDRIKPAVEGALKAIRLMDLTLVGIEVPIWHPHLDCAGTIDLVGQQENGQYVIVDWKRAARFSADYQWQIAGYGASFNMVMGLNVDDPDPRCRAALLKVCKLPREEGEDVEVRDADYHYGYTMFRKAMEWHTALNDKNPLAWK